MTKKKMSFCCLLFLVFLMFAGTTEAKVKVNNHTYGSSNIKYIQIKGAKYKSLNQKMKALAKKTRENEKALKAKFKKNSEEWKNSNCSLKYKISMDSSGVLSIYYTYVWNNAIGGTNTFRYGFTTYKGKVYRLNQVLKNSSMKKKLNSLLKTELENANAQNGGIPKNVLTTSREFYLKKGEVVLISQPYEIPGGWYKEFRFSNVFTKFATISTVPKKFQGKWYTYYPKNGKNHAFYEIQEYTKTNHKTYYVTIKGKKFTPKGYKILPTSFFSISYDKRVKYWNAFPLFEHVGGYAMVHGSTKYNSKKVDFIGWGQNGYQIAFRKRIPHSIYCYKIKDGSYVSWSKLNKQ